MKCGNEYRMEAVKRTIEYYVDTFDASSLSRCKGELVRDNFPSITKYVENGKSCHEFVTFMSKLYQLNHDILFYILLNNDVREDLLTVMDKSIRSNERMQSYLISYSMRSKDLFQSLKNRNLYDWNVFRKKYCTVEHVDAMKWIEQNGVDVVNSKKHFNEFVKYSPSEVMEYLIDEKGVTVEYMSENIWRASRDILRMVYRLKGMEGIQNIDPTKIEYNYEEVKFLKSIGYKFDKSICSIRSSRRLLYALICFKVLKYEDLNERQSKAFDEYVKRTDIKACKHFYPYMKEIRKKKIMTVILCIRKTCTCILQKEIIWNILDLAYSPINERGPL